MAVLLFRHFGIQLLFTVGVILVAGLLISGAKRLFLKCCGRGAFRVEQITGIVGTPIHELSHAFFCLIFGHKIKEIRLWSARAEGGNLGYVSHTYRKRNLWHQIGNFFIGIAPILGGSGVLLLLLWGLLPDSADVVFSVFRSLVSEEGTGLLQMLPEQVLAVLRAIFCKENLLRWHWYLYLFLAVLIVLHMEISRSDLRSGFVGFLFVAGGLLLADLILLLAYPTGLDVVTSATVAVGAILTVFLCLAVLVSAILFMIALIALPFRRG